MPSTATTPLRYHVRRTLAGCALLAAYALPAVAQAPAVPAADAAKPFEALSASVHSIRDSLVMLARAQVGTRYLTGGQSPERGFDCSGLVRYVMAALEVKLPRTARQQATSGLAVARDPNRLRPGDLLTFGKGKTGVSHIGIYVGNGRYVHASSVAGRVIESEIDRPKSSLIRKWAGVRRLLGDKSDSAKVQKRG